MSDYNSEQQAEGASEVVAEIKEFFIKSIKDSYTICEIIAILDGWDC